MGFVPLKHASCKYDTPTCSSKELLSTIVLCLCAGAATAAPAASAPAAPAATQAAPPPSAKPAPRVLHAQGLGPPTQTLRHVTTGRTRQRRGHASAGGAPGVRRRLPRPRSGATGNAPNVQMASSETVCCSLLCCLGVVARAATACLCGFQRWDTANAGGAPGVRRRLAPHQSGATGNASCQTNACSADWIAAESRKRPGAFVGVSQGSDDAWPPLKAGPLAMRVAKITKNKQTMQR
jgi:hypothetical protein